MRTAFLSVTVFLFVSFPGYLFAQDRCDCPAAQQQRFGFGRNYEMGSFDSAVYYVNKVKDGKKNICDAFFNNWMSQLSISKKEFENARLYFKNEFTILKKLNCPNRLARHYTNYSSFYNYLNKHDSAVYVSLKAMALAEQLNAKEELIRICTNVGSLFTQLKQDEKSFEYYLKANSIAEEFNDTANLAMTLTQLALSYLTRAQNTGKPVFTDSAFILAKKGLGYAKLTGGIFYILDAYHAIGQYYADKKEYSKAAAYADSILITAPKSGSNYFNRNFLVAYGLKSDALFELNSMASARQMADSALKYAELFNEQLATGPLDKIYMTSKKLNDFSRALWAHERIKKINDSLFSLEKNAVIAELDKKYSQEKNERKIEKLNQQKVFYVLLAIAGLLLAAAIAFYLRQQSLKHKQTILETEQRLNRARMNPHFFFNALTSLQKVALQQADGMEMASNLSRFSHIMRETLESTYKEYVTVEQEIQFLNEYLAIQQIRFPRKFSYTVTAAKEMEQDELLIPALIIQPFAENSIEHGFADIDYAGEINIHFANGENELVIRINDNGRGLSDSAKGNSEHISRASQIIKDRIYLLNIKLKTKARFSIENNADGKGAVVIIHLPIIHSSENTAD